MLLINIKYEQGFLGKKIEFFYFLTLNENKSIFISLMLFIITF